MMTTTTTTTTTTTGIPHLSNNYHNNNDTGLYLPVMLHKNDEDDEDVPAALFNNNNTNSPVVQRTTTTTTTSTTINSLSIMAARLAIFKGNIGPGILNLPHAFALTGPGLGSGLFVLIATQGIYSMWLLVECQRYVRHNKTSETTTATTAAVLLITAAPAVTTSPPTNTNPTTGTTTTTTWTFMAVAESALGNIGGRIVELFLFILQGGVCCVFLSLISTHLHAVFPLGMTNLQAVWLTSSCMMVGCLWRDLKDMFWLNATANLFMLLAIGTAIIAGIVRTIIITPPIHHQPSNGIALVEEPGPANTTTTATTTDMPIHSYSSIVIIFISDMFYAFEGIGLVLPIENAYNHEQNAVTFSTVLIQSMSIVAILFAMTGLVASMGIPNVPSGSITAYLHQTYPKVAWYGICNILVLVATALTFPLQLAPAAQVLEQWVIQNRHGWCCSCDGGDDDVRSDHSSDLQQDDTVSEESTMMLPIEDTTIVMSNECPTSLHPHCRHREKRRRSTYIIEQPQHLNTSLHTNEKDGLVMMHESPRSHCLTELSSKNDQCIDTTGGIHSDNKIDPSIQCTTATFVSDPTTIGTNTTFTNYSSGLLQRWALVLLFTLVVIATKNDLSLLMGLFGAVGQTTLAGMPCAIHLALQYQGQMPRRGILRTIVDISILLLTTIVMITGCIVSLQQIIVQQ